MITGLILAVVIAIVYRGGYAHGRYYLRKSLDAPQNGDCMCGHGSNIHYQGKILGSCTWKTDYFNESTRTTWTRKCQCRKFTATEKKLLNSA
jgi:hypothetical protein